MSDWFRVPEWCVLSDDPAEAGAAVWLLGRWHLGREPSVAECKRAWGWGWDRCNAFAIRMWEWAETAGARRPSEAPGKPGRNRGGSTGKPGRLDTVQTPTVDESRGAIGEASGSNRGASYARGSLARERDEERDQNTPLPPTGGPPAPRAPASDPPAVHVPPEQGSPPVPPPEDAALAPQPALPPWVPKAPDCRPHPRAAVMAMVLDVLAQVRSPPDAQPEDEPLPVRNPAACGTDAALVVGLWKALGRPEPDALAADLVLVARAARWSPDPLFAREIRAEGWSDGQDRSRKVANICRQKPPRDSSGATWSERLEAARRWEEAGCPVAAPPPVPQTAAEREAIEDAEIERLRFRPRLEVVS